jgi:hypothetical protein
MKQTTDRKAIENSEVEYSLTGESVLKAATIPQPPTAKTPTVVRITHCNGYGFIDAEIFVRLGNPDSPLGAEDFDTVTDWRKATLVEDSVWSDEREDWVPRTEENAEEEATWSGTYDAELQIPAGRHLIEIKIVSAVDAVCSIVLSNWEVSVGVISMGPDLALQPTPPSRTY